MTLVEFDSAQAAGLLREDNISCGYFPYFLKAAGSWYISGVDKDTEAYQMFFIPTFYQPVLLRVTSRRGQSPVVSAARLSGAGGYEVGQIDRVTSRLMSRAEWLEWRRLVDRLGFWSNDSPFTRDEPSACMDGTTYLFEGSRFERGAGNLDFVTHKVWSPYCPEGEIDERLWAATSFLFKLTQTYPRDQ